MKALPSINSISLGWKYNYHKDKALIRKKSHGDFIISIIVAFLIILLVTQILAHFDRSLKVGIAEEGLTRQMLGPDSKLIM